MNIKIFIEPISNAEELIKQLLHEEFGIAEATAVVLFNKSIKLHFDKLKDTMWLVAETNYIDRVYRDSYYHYYSSKLSTYKRNCIRISLFENEITSDDFRQSTQYQKLQDQYRGFFVLRPNEPFLMGRNIISPNALKTTNFLSCTAKFDVTVNSVKLNIEGFPHSSQDTETISCAETTLWALMEYFSHRYPEYKPVLPSNIIKTLNKVSSERQVPSKGLNIQQMSFALKEYGFGSRIYGKDQYKVDFDQLISCYIESGIPLVIAIEDRHSSIGHALLCVGHEKVTTDMTDALKPHNINNPILKKTASSKRITLYDFDSVNKEFLFVDDNKPTYQKATLSAPAAHYNPSWHNCKISYFIVPLYPKIYLEAFEAKSFIARFLIKGPMPLTDGSDVLIRTYLASSRSFKDKLAINSSFSVDLRDIILEMSMPKFIWVSEISNKNLIKQQKANGLVILDATEANISFNKPLIIAAYQGKVINFEGDSGKLENNILPLNDFFIFENNLKPF